jgi:hypothetical protein
MSVLENIVTIDTFHIWLNRTNEIIDLINENVVLAGPGEGFTVVGNATIDGGLIVDTLEANTISSGTLQVGQIFNANTSPISITSTTIFSSSNTENLIDLQTNSANTSPTMRFINNGNARWLISPANSENTAPLVIKTESAVTPQFSLNQSGQLSANTFSGNGASLTNLNANNISAGTLPLARGGTGGTTAAQARTNLELVPTTSATDATANRLLKNGDWAGLLSGSYVMRCTYGGTANAIALTTGAGISGTPPTGLKLRFLATAANTGPTTILIDGGAPIACRTSGGEILPAGYIRAGSVNDGYLETEVIFNGTYWIVLSSEDRLPSDISGNFLSYQLNSLNTTSNNWATTDTISSPRVGLWRISVFSGVAGSTVGRIRVAVNDDPIVSTITADPVADNFSPALFREGFLRLTGQNLLVQTGRNSSTGGTAQLRSIRIFGEWMGH